MNIKDWKNIDVEYGEESFQVKVPPYCQILSMGKIVPLEDPESKIEEALSHPVGSLPLEKIVASSKKNASDVRVAITVSDNTRPVPYNAESKEGILYPLLKRLKKAGVRNENIIIIVGTGTHMPTSSQWKEKTFSKLITDNYRIIDHSSTSPHFFSLGKIQGVEVKINEDFMRADIRVATGLVEPHFMAGVSGGRKAICPGLINLEATYLFHGVEFMNNPRATNLILEDNPCHNFALKVARKAKVDFSINVTINSEGKLTGVFAGNIEKAHLEAVKKLKEYSLIPCPYEYDIVLTQGGKVAVNHYQAAKAAYGTVPVIKKGGMVILVAHNNDEEPVGKDDYKKVLKVLKEKGPGKFTEFIKSDSWQFIPDQWQVQKWDQFFKKISSFDNLIYCTTNIPPQVLKKLPGRSGYNFVKRIK